MRSRIVRLGNSHGIRIPNVLLEQTGLRGEVEIIARGETLIIGPAKPPRAGLPLLKPWPVAATTLWSTALRRVCRAGMRANGNGENDPAAREENSGAFVEERRLLK
jgi:virulence-associated protein VagC